VTEDATRAAVREFYAAQEQRDFDRVATLLHENIDWMMFYPVQVFPFTGVRQGRRAVMECLAEMMKLYATERFVPEITISEGDRAAVMADVAFVQRASGRTLRFRLVHFLRFRDGLLVEFREFADSFDVVEQALGRWLEV
jgi:ketosteroid isomerase-like protein